MRGSAVANLCKCWEDEERMETRISNTSSALSLRLWWSIRDIIDRGDAAGVRSKFGETSG